MNVHNRWFQLCASLVAMVMIANLQYAWTLFVRPMQAETGWQLSDIQFAFTLFILLQTWVQPLDGWLVDRLGPRGFITVAGLLCALGWAGLGYATSLPMLYGLYCVAGVGAAFVYSASIGSALKWFTERRGLASGIMAAGFGGGTALFIPIISWFIGSGGYRTAFIATGLFQGLVIIVVAQFLRHPPAPAASAAVPTSGGASQLGRRQFTTLEMLRTPQFYILYVMFVLMSTGGLMVTANAGPMASSFGLSVAALTVAATLSPLANGGSRVFWGWASDRLGRENTMILAFCLQAIALCLIVLVGQNAVLFSVVLVLIYFTWGEIYALFPATSGDYFGTRHATSNYAVLYTAKGVAAIFGGWVGAMLFEQSGSWTMGAFGSAAMALVAAIMAVVLRSMARSAKARDAVA
jgi:OFA family oxalate/formate antiporter-like MFS transporter